MTKKELMNYILYGDSSAIDERTDWVAEQIKKKVAESMLEEIKSQPLSFRRYSPGNPPPKERLSNLPLITVPSHPEMIRPIDTPNFWIDQFLSAFSKRPFEKVIKINISEEKTVMQSKTVFDLYFKRAYEALDKAAEEKLDQLIEEDENIRLIKITIMELNSKLKDTQRNFPGILTPRSPAACTGYTRKRMEKWCKKKTDARRRLDRMHEEVEALLLSCETYNQAWVILRAYGIINSNGEMQEYKPF